ncbi:TonB-dependent receptor [Puniceicoccaceae bacterium K14]|nr:TonB-dependent receptor [Puniceicoccaceae bacterium K14]
MNTKSYTPCKIAVLGTAVSLLASPIFGDTSENKVQLEEVVLTADDFSIGDLISTEELELIQPTSLSELFDGSQAIHVNGGKSQGQQIFINNLESTLANVTIDGAVQGNIYHHTAQVVVEPDLLKKVDLVAGAGSALDGAGALAGAIRFETKNAFELLDGNQVGGQSKVSYYSNGEGYKLSQSLYGQLSDSWAAIIAGSYTDRDTFEDGSGRDIENSDYTRDSIFTKVTGSFSGNDEFNFSAESLSDEFISYDRVNINNEVLGSTGRPLGLLQKQHMERKTVTLSYDTNPEDIEWLNLETSIYNNLQDNQRLEQGVGGELESTGLDVRNTNDAGMFSVTYGFDYRDEKGTMYGDWESLDFGPDYAASETTEIYGLYAQSTIKASEQIKVTFGARFDQYDHEAKDGTTFESNKVSPNAAITFQATEDLSFTAGYAEAYRGVSTRDLFAFRKPPEGTDGEEADTFKLSFDFDNGTIFANGYYFDQSIDNYVYPSGWGSFGDIKNDGYELNIGARFEQFHASLGVSDSEPNVEGYEYDDDYGIVVAGRYWLTKFGYSFDGDIPVQIEWVSEFREGIDEILLPGGGEWAARAEKASYDVHSIRVRVDAPFAEGLSFNLNVENLFDVTYQDHTIYADNGLNSNGRVISVIGSYKF